MKPDFNNYEIMIVDWLDGKLSEEEVNNLIRFLEMNPSLKEEIEGLENLHIGPATGSFKSKNNLKRTPSELSEDQFEKLCISSVEGLLNDEENSELEAAIASDPSRKNDYILFQKTKLAAPQLTYTNKKSLYRSGLGSRIVRAGAYISGVAATAIIAILIIGKTPSDTTAKNLSSGNVKPETVIVSEAENLPEIAMADKETKKPESKTEDLKTALTALPEDSLQQGELSGENVARIENPFLAKTYYIMYPGFSSSAENSALAFIDTSLPLNIMNGENQTGRLEGILAMFVRKKVLGEKEPQGGALKGYELADAGITGLNKLLGWEMSLEKNKDDVGEVKSVYFNSKLIRFTANVKKSEPAP